MRRSRGGFFENEERDGTDGQTDGQAGPGSIFAGHTRSPTPSTKKRRKSSGDDVGRASVLLPPLHFTVGGIDVRRGGGRERGRRPLADLPPGTRLASMSRAGGCRY
jgi:hypothetical protein